jgi:acyl dehydratase
MRRFRRSKGAEMGINYGFDRLRFVSPVKCGARVRARFKLVSANVRPSGWVQVRLRRHHRDRRRIKPAITARWLTLAVLKRDDNRRPA